MFNIRLQRQSLLQDMISELSKRISILWICE